jgi:hypothetical protein
VTASTIFAWLMSLAFLLDASSPPLPIRRPSTHALAIANAVASTDKPQFWAAVLDVWAAFESGYGPTTIAGGCPGVPVGTPCKRDDGAESCGPWMVACSRVPRTATLAEQAKIALDVMRASFDACPEHPFGIYAGGKCQKYRVVDFRVARIRAELAVPLEVAP